MSKKNVDLTEFWAANDLHNKNCEPQFLPMKFHERDNGKAIAYMYPDKHYSKQCRFYRYLPRFLDKNIGKPFNEVFSKFCKEHSEYIGSLNTRSKFKEQFIEYCPENRHLWKKPCFRIDPDGRIQYTDEKKKVKHGNRRNLYETNTEFYYVFNIGLLKKYPSFDNCLYNILGKQLYNFCQTEDRFNIIFVNKISAYLNDAANLRKLLQSVKDDGYDNYHIREDFIDCLFIKKTDGIPYTVNKNDATYIKLLAEHNDAQKKKMREYELERKERYNNALKEIWRIREERRKQDIIDRTHLNFDDKSFKKEKEE